MSALGVVGVCGLSVGIVAINNVSHGKDPFPSLMAGGIFTAGCVGIAALDKDIAMAVACVFLLANVLTKSDPFLALIGGVTSGHKPPVTASSTTNSAHAN